MFSGDGWDAFALAALPWLQDLAPALGFMLAVGLALSVGGLLLSLSKNSGAGNSPSKSVGKL